MEWLNGGKTSRAFLANSSIQSSIYVIEIHFKWLFSEDLTGPELHLNVARPVVCEPFDASRQVPHVVVVHSVSPPVSDGRFVHLKPTEPFGCGSAVAVPLSS